MILQKGNFNQKFYNNVTWKSSSKAFSIYKEPLFGKRNFRNKLIIMDKNSSFDKNLSFIILRKPAKYHFQTLFTFQGIQKSFFTFRHFTTSWRKNWNETENVFVRLASKILKPATSGFSCLIHYSIIGIYVYIYKLSTPLYIYTKMWD